MKNSCHHSPTAGIRTSDLPHSMTITMGKLSLTLPRRPNSRSTLIINSIQEFLYIAKKLIIESKHNLEYFDFRLTNISTWMSVDIKYH